MTIAANVCVFIASAVSGFAFGMFLFLLGALRELNKMKKEQCNDRN